MTHSSTEATRADQLTALLHQAPDASDHDAVRQYIATLCDAGVAVMLIYPGTKKPFDGRTVRRKLADDRAAQAQAHEAGRRNWSAVPSPSGLTLATTDATVLIGANGYLDEYIKAFGDEVAINLAVEVGGSGLIVVDCDTTSQLVALLDIAAAPENMPVTVESPGSQDAEGNWAHDPGCGHFYFTVPEGVNLPTNLGALTWPSSGNTADGFAVLWNRRYVLVPPSTRKEGEYKAVGVCMPAPAWLLDAICTRGQEHADRACRARHRSADDPIARWGATVTWAQILSPTDWTPAGTTHNCGCDIWTAPGAHGSDKSATAHEPGCPVFDSADPCLHIWTDHDIEPFDQAVQDYGPHLTRLRAVAAIHYDNDLGAAMEDLDLHDADDIVTLSARNGGGQIRQNTPASKRRLQLTWASEIEPEPVPWLWVDISAANTWTPGSPAGSAPDPMFVDDIASVAKGRTWTAPEVETDGRIACGMVSIAAGREGSGKSSFGIWLTARVTRGTLPGAHYGQPKAVFYLATEDSWKHTLVPRLMAAGADMRKVGRIEVVQHKGAVVTLSLPDDTELLTQAIIDNGVALVVVDPLMSTLGQGLDANGSRDVRTALEPLAAMADRTGAAVVGIAHFNKASGLDSLSRITGSGAFKDIPRAVFVFADDGDERVFSQRKNSTGRCDLPSLVYEIQSEVIDTPTGKTSTGLFRFTGIAQRTVEDMLADERRPRRRRSDAAQFIIDYITEHADEQTGEVDSADVVAAGEAEGYKGKQLTDARNRCSDPKISTRKEGYGRASRTFWKIKRE
ncbi:AAA family ATPase [Mycobacterium sp. C31M]